MTFSFYCCIYLNMRGESRTMAYSFETAGVINTFYKSIHGLL